MKLKRTRRQMIGIAGAWAVLTLGVGPANARAQSAAAGSEATATQPPTTTTTTTTTQQPPTTTTTTDDDDDDHRFAHARNLRIRPGGCDRGLQEEQP